MSDQDPELLLLNILKNDPDVITLLRRSDGAFRIYPIQLEQESDFPALTYRRISGQGQPAMSGGPYRTMGGQSLIRISWKIYAHSLADVSTLRKTLLRVSANFSAVLVHEMADIESDVQPPVFCLVIDFKMWYTDN